MTDQAAPDDVVFSEIHRLVTACLEGVATATMLKQLDELVTDDPKARSLYLEYLRDSIGLRYVVLSPEEERLGAFRSGVDADADIPVNPAIFLPPQIPRPLSTTFHTTLGYFSEGMPLAYLLATVIFGFGLLIGSRIYVSSPDQVATESPPTAKSNATCDPQNPSVGRITGMVDCQWADDSMPCINGAHVSLGRKYALTSGLVEITYDTGARVILQAPVTYDVESRNGGFLSIGKLTGKAEVEKAKGFVVRTPTATVTDLGTEFGVEVSSEGTTTSHVYRGSIKLDVAAADEHAGTTAQVLHENESASVTKKADALGSDTRLTVVRLTAPVVSFVREIPKPQIKRLDLADVVAGGDGFSGRRNRGVDPTNGHMVEAPSFQYFIGDGTYHRVEGSPLIDGVFMPFPQSESDPVQVDSAGHAVAGFLATSEDQTIGPIWAGAGEGNCSVLGGVDYNSPEHGMIALHANKGVTFDLNAIRQVHPGWKLLRFRGTTGIAVPTHDNLIANGDFASGMDGWAGDGEPDTSSPDGHNMVLKSRCKSRCTATSVSVEEKQEYHLAFMAASPSATATNSQLGSIVVRFSLKQGDRSIDVEPPFVVSADRLNRGWNTYNTMWTTPALRTPGGACPEFTFEATGGRAGERVAIDNVAFTRIQSPGYANIVVFVDGQARFRRREINRDSGAIPVIVPINDGDRFLTFVATAVANAHVGNDHTMFGNPQIDMMSDQPVAPLNGLGSPRSKRDRAN